MARPPYEDIRIQSAILNYVIAEGHHDDAVSVLLERCSLKYGREDAARAVLDLLVRGVLSIDAGNVVPFRMRLGAQRAVLKRIIHEGHRDETILDLSILLSPDSSLGSVESAVVELVAADLLSIEAGKVVPGEVASADQPGP
jgi:hypothetical protein